MCLCMYVCVLERVWDIRNGVDKNRKFSRFLVFSASSSSSFWLSLFDVRAVG